MDFPQFGKLIKDITTGKQLPDSVYVHESAVSAVPEKLAGLVLRIAGALKIPEDEKPLCC